MRYSVKNGAAVAVLATALLLGAATPSRATFEVILSETGYASQTYNFGTSYGNVTQISFGGVMDMVVSTTIGDFSIQSDIATSNSGSGLSPATLTINQLSIRLTGGAGEATLKITVQDDGFTAPQGPVWVGTQLSTTSLTNAGDSVSFQSFVNSTPGTVLTLSTAPSGTSAADGGPLYQTTNPFTVKNVTTVNLSTGGLLQSTGTTTVNPVPAPSGTVLVLSGLPLLGLCSLVGMRRKR